MVELRAIKDWQLLKCHPDMAPAKKAWMVRQAKAGQRPYTLSAAEWAWCPLNPRGIKRDKKATKRTARLVETALAK